MEEELEKKEEELAAREAKLGIPTDAPRIPARNLLPVEVPAVAAASALPTLQPASPKPTSPRSTHHRHHHHVAHSGESSYATREEISEETEKLIPVLRAELEATAGREKQAVAPTHATHCKRAQFRVFKGRRKCV